MKRRTRSFSIARYITACGIGILWLSTGCGKAYQASITRTGSDTYVPTPSEQVVKIYDVSEPEEQSMQADMLRSQDNLKIGRISLERLQEDMPLPRSQDYIEIGRISLDGPLTAKAGHITKVVGRYKSWRPRYSEVLQKKARRMGGHAVLVNHVEPYTIPVRSVERAMDLIPDDSVGRFFSNGAVRPRVSVVGSTLMRVKIEARVVRWKE